MGFVVGNFRPVLRTQIGQSSRVCRPRRREPPVACAGLEVVSTSLKHVRDLVRIDRNRDSRIAKVAVPALGTLMVEPMLSLVDTAFLGRLGVAQLAGVGMATVLLANGSALFNFLAASTTPLVAEAGEEKASIVVVQSLYVACFLGLILGIGLFAAAPTLCRGLAGAASLTAVPHAIIYTRWRALAAPALLAGYVLSGAYRGLEDTTTPLYIALASNSVNLVLDYVTIFMWGWGVAGAAFATAIAQYLNVIGLLMPMFRRKWLRASDFLRMPTPSSLQKIGYGAVLSVRTFSILTTFTMSSKFAALRGAAYLAAYELARQVWVLQAYVLDALAVAALSIVSVCLANDDKSEARAYCTRLLQLGLISGTVLGFVVFCCADSIPALLSGDAMTQSLATSLFRSFAILQPICALVFVFDGIFVAARDFNYTSRSIFLAAVASWLAILYATTRPDWGIGSVWFGINVLMIGRVVALGSRFMSKRFPISPMRGTTSEISG